MIKICRYLFEPIMGRDNQFVDFDKFGKYLSHELKTFNSCMECDVQLTPNIPYFIGFDQSSSNTGMIIKNYNNTEVYLCEVSKSKSMDAYESMFQLEMFLKKMCEGTNIAYLIYERPILTEFYRSTRVAFALEGIIKQLPKRYECFRPAELGHIENPAWRSRVIPEMFSHVPKKDAAMLSLYSEYPWIKYYGCSIGKDNDIFEAIGVLFGWYRASFDKQGRPLVREDSYNGAIGCFILPDVSAEEVSIAFKERGFDSRYLMANPELSLYQNVAKAAIEDVVTVVQFEDIHSQLLLYIEAGYSFKPLDKISVVVVTPNHISSKIYSITGDEFSFAL